MERQSQFNLCWHKLLHKARHNVNATIPATKVHTITSRHVNQEYRISVALPYSYGAMADKTYPTIYLLDANWYFGMVTETTRIMERCDAFRETIVVGVGYPVDEPLEEAFNQVMMLRFRDLTPIVDSNFEKTREEATGNKVRTGGATGFLAFIESELIPLIETKYRATRGDRILAGHSLGGLFTLYVLFHRADLFRGFVVASPSLWYGNNITFTYESTFAEQHKTLPVNVYVGVGEREQSPEHPMVADVYQLVASMESRKYEGLALTRHIVPGCEHCASTAPQFQAGLQAVLA